MVIDNVIFALTILVFIATLVIASYRLRKMKRPESD